MRIIINLSSCKCNRSPPHYTCAVIVGNIPLFCFFFLEFLPSYTQLHSLFPQKTSQWGETQLNLQSLIQEEPEACLCDTLPPGREDERGRMRKGQFVHQPQQQGRQALNSVEAHHYMHHLPDAHLTCNNQITGFQRERERERDVEYLNRVPSHNISGPPQGHLSKQCERLILCQGAASIACHQFSLAPSLLRKRDGFYKIPNFPAQSDIQQLSFLAHE